jgi:hypothetical protein
VVVKFEEPWKHVLANEWDVVRPSSGTHDVNETMEIETKRKPGRLLGLLHTAQVAVRIYARDATSDLSGLGCSRGSGPGRTRTDLRRLWSLITRHWNLRGSPLAPDDPHGRAEPRALKR